MIRHRVATNAVAGAADDLDGFAVHTTEDVAFPCADAADLVAGGSARDEERLLGARPAGERDGGAGRVGAEVVALPQGVVRGQEHLAVGRAGDDVGLSGCRTAEDMVGAADVDGRRSPATRRVARDVGTDEVALETGAAPGDRKTFEGRPVVDHEAAEHRRRVGGAAADPPCAGTGQVDLDSQRGRPGGARGAGLGGAVDANVAADPWKG